MIRLADYLKGSLSRLFHGETNASGSHSAVTISPSNSTDSNTSYASSSSHIRSCIVYNRTFTRILARSIKPQRAAFPEGWSNRWTSWEYNFSYGGLYERPYLQIWLELKYRLSFDCLEVLMFKMDTDQVVFRYKGRFYRYGAEETTLFVYRESYMDGDAFLERWNEDEKLELVPPEGTDAQCLKMVMVQSEMEDWRAHKEGEFVEL
ncbi:hypothetical protein C8J56DRAFT_1164931 [Mycena floridula]|nr:hypothetical protein C8J56DRAFT_1164931 [Mycena floridula]